MVILLKILHLFSMSEAAQLANAITLIKEQKRRGYPAFAVATGTAMSSFRLHEQSLKEIEAIVLNNGSALPLQLRRQKYDLVHVHSPGLLALGGRLSGEQQIPLVVTCHEAPPDKEAHRFLSRAKAIICTASRDAYELQKYGSKIRIIPQCVDLEEYKPREKSGPVKITLVARLDNTKMEGFRHLCKAVNLLENVTFTVASNARPPGIKATFTGQTAYLPQILAASDIIVGTGRSTIEGLAAGNAALVLGRTYQGLVTPKTVQKSRHLDLSGLYGTKPCYKDIFYDLAPLTQDRNELCSVQQFSRELAAQRYCSKKITEEVYQVYRELLSQAG